MWEDFYEEVAFELRSEGEVASVGGGSQGGGGNRIPGESKYSECM